VILAQGIPAIEATPWKTITVVAFTIGLLVGMANAIAQFIRTRLQARQVQLSEQIRDSLGNMLAGMAELQAATWDMHETMLSNAKTALYPGKKAK
jgi:hypothetical protein